MTISIDQLKSMLTTADIKYFMAPDRPAVLMGFTGLTGSYQIIALVELDGRFMQLRTLGYASCPASHPHVDTVLKTLAALDYTLRLTKFAWDATDGEIVAYADLWLEDATLTQKQLMAILSAFIPAIDLGHQRIVKTMETGVDPEATPGGGRDILQQLRDLVGGQPAGPTTGGAPVPVEGPVSV